MTRFSRTLVGAALGLLAVAAHAQERPTQPVYRVEDPPVNASPAAGVIVDPQVKQVSIPAGATRPKGLENSPLKVYEVPGEHPLMPCIRLAKQGLNEFNQNIKGYTAVLVKKERINGNEGGPQTLALKVRHEPFSVYAKFLKPQAVAGQEVLYNSAVSKDKMIAMGTGWQRTFGKVPLAVNGRMAMKDQRYPITMTGMKFLTEELLRIANQDVKFGECNVTYAVTQIGGRPSTMIRVEHPVPRKNFRFNIARIFIDHQMQIPTGYDAYSWPLQKGGRPVLEESYFHTNVVLNPGFTDADFDKNNPNLFK